MLANFRDRFSKPFRKVTQNSITDEVEITNEQIRRKLKRGDHICSRRKNDTYYHHGIYIGKNKVIHFQGPHKVNNYQSVVCEQCNYMPQPKGTVVKTCLDCFCVGNLLCISEYGIRASEAMEIWVSKNVNADGIIYTYKNGNVHLGIWTDDNTVIHLARPRYGFIASTLCPKCRFKRKRTLLSRKTNGAMVETCLECFLEGYLLYTNDHQLHVTTTDIDDWIAYDKELRPDKSRFITQMAAEIVHNARIMNTQWNPLMKFKVMRYYFEHVKGESDRAVYKSNGVQVYQRHCKRSAKQVVDDANKYEDYTDKFGNYNLIWNNCEHFAFMCKTGVARSIQVDYYVGRKTVVLWKFNMSAFFFRHFI